MSEHPIIFSTEMVRAILDGRKTQTRRIVKFEVLPTWEIDCLVQGAVYFRLIDRPDIASVRVKCPYGEVGDRFWVRETWDFRPITADRIAIIGYKADVATKAIDVPQGYNPTIHQKWRSPYHMPRWAARIFLEITNIRVERLQDIKREDCLAEGIELIYGSRDLSPSSGYRDYSGTVEACGATASFRTLWDSLNDKRSYGWDKNPWVWVIEFKKI